MKSGIHPDYHHVVFQDRSTGDVFLTRSTATTSAGSSRHPRPAEGRAGHPGDHRDSDLQGGATVVSLDRHEPDDPVQRHLSVDLADHSGRGRHPILVDFEEPMGKETLDQVREFLGRHATPEDIAPAVVFLASHGSRWLDGATITADGGQVAAIAVGQVPAPVIRRRQPEGTRTWHRQPEGTRT